MKEELNPKDNKLRVGRSTEDRYRDDMIALTYMNSAQFGQGISMTAGHPNVSMSEEEDPAPPLQVEEISQRLISATSQISTTDFMEVDNEPIVEEQRIESPPPLTIVPMELPEEQPIVTGLTVEDVGSQEIVQPTPPVEPEVFDIPATAIPPVPQEPAEPEPPIILSPASVEMLETPPVNVEVPPPPEPSKAPEFKPEPLEQPEESPAFPFLEGPEFKIDPPFSQDQLNKDMETYVPDGMSLGGLEELQLSSREYMGALNRVIFGMVEDLKDFRSRLIEIEAVYDRRYFRHRK